MPKPLSMDLRELLISVVERGMSRRSVAIRWVDQKQRTASVRSVARDGDHRSHYLAAQADEILCLANDADRTLAELANYVRQTHGLEAAPTVVWYLLDPAMIKKFADLADRAIPCGKPASPRGGGGIASSRCPIGAQSISAMMSYNEARFSQAPNIVSRPIRRRGVVAYLPCFLNRIRKITPKQIPIEHRSPSATPITPIFAYW